MKIGFFITARLKSSRLKQKILLDLNGKEVMNRVIERAKKVKGIDGIVLCTSVNPQDSVLYDIALENRIQFYPGSQDDVLTRILNSAEYYGYDAILSITADCPVFPIHFSNLIVDYYKNNNVDYIYINGLPKGMRPYMINVEALKIANYIKNETDTEIWGPYINQPDLFSIIELNINGFNFNENTRLTIDYFEDYRLINNIYKHFKPNYSPTIYDVFDILNKNPDLLKINENCQHATLDNDKITKINNTVTENIKKAEKYSLKIGKKLNPGFRKIDLNI